MAVDWQVLCVVTLVCLAAGYLVHRAWRAVRGGKAGCGGTCRCSGEASSEPNVTLVPADQLTLRPRSGGPHV